jgi:hypothetical protein
MTTTLPELGTEYDVKLLGDMVVYVPVEETEHRPAEGSKESSSKINSAGRLTTRPGEIPSTSQRRVSA